MDGPYGGILNVSIYHMHFFRATNFLILILIAAFLLPTDLCEHFPDVFFFCKYNYIPQCSGIFKWCELQVLSICMLKVLSEQSDLIKF